MLDSSCEIDLLKRCGGLTAFERMTGSAARRAVAVATAAHNVPSSNSAAHVVPHSGPTISDQGGSDQLKSVGLVACSKSKLNRPAPASDLYTGALFRRAARYAEATYDRWFILSARYGLVSPDDVLKPYDQTLAELTPDERAMWALIVATELRDAGLLDDRITFFFHAGEHYRRDLEPHLRSAVPLQGMRIGQQLAWYIDRGY